MGGRRGNILGISSAVGSLLELFRDCFFVDVDGVVADPPLAMVAETSLCDLDTECEGRFAIELLGTRSF